MGRRGPRQDRRVVTTVEAAAIARVEGAFDDDDEEHHRLVGAMCSLLKQAIASVDGVYARLDLIDAIAEGVNVRHDPSGYGLVCTRYVPGISEDRLRRGMCRADYLAWRRDGSPNVVPWARARQRADDLDQLAGTEDATGPSEATR